MSDFRKLEVWKRAMNFVTDIYSLTQNFPKFELYGLVSQMRRCAVSIPSNIAEGNSDRTQKNYIYFLNIALGSAFELETQILISSNLKYIERKDSDKLIDELNQIQKMISGLKKALKN